MEEEKVRERIKEKKEKISMSSALTKISRINQCPSISFRGRRRGGGKDKGKGKGKGGENKYVSCFDQNL